MPDIDESIVIACAADDNFAMPMAVTLHSALSHLPRNMRPTLYLLDGGLCLENKTRIEKVCRDTLPSANITFVQPDLSVFHDLPLTGALKTAAYIRLSVPATLPDRYEKIIYLDSDLVVRCDLSDIWQLSIDDVYAAAVPDYGNPYVSQGLRHTYGDLNISPDAAYLNSGFLVMNLRRWRDDEVVKRILEYTQKYRDYNRFADQDGINAVLAGKWLELDLRYNVQVDALRAIDSWPESSFKQHMRATSRSLLRDPAIVHFISARKPWNSGLFNPARHYFTKALKASGWFTAQEYRVWRRAWLRSSIATIYEDVRRGHIQKRILGKAMSRLS